MRLSLLLFILVVLCNSALGASKESETTTSTAPIVTAWLIPHSHCDVGWKETVDQYYYENVSLILDQVVQALQQNPTRKFVWAETVWIKMWWYSQSPDTQAALRKFVQEGRFEFVGGGWSMNDEAVAHYHAVIEQMTEGHLLLLREFNFTPIVSWQIDPFGASSITPTIFAKMGIKYHVIDRIDDRLKTNFSDLAPGSGIMPNQKSFEFIWKPSPSLGDNLKIFTHVLDSLYVPPFKCSNGTCSGFNWADNPKQNPPITDANVKERSDLLVQILQRRASWYRTPNLLVPFGSDFNYQNASRMFDNIERLIEYVNEHNDTYGMVLKYGTLSDYFKAVYPQALQSDEHDTKNNDSNVDTLFPVKDDWGDFFPYATCWGSDLATFNNCISYWAGFYASFPVLKQYTRTRASILRMADTLFVLSNLRPQHNDEKMNWNDLYSSLDLLRQAEGVLEHHDAITGTAMDFVRADYFDRLEAGTKATLTAAAGLLSHLLRKNNDTISPPLVALDFSPLNQTGLSPIQSLLSNPNKGKGGGYIPLVVHNSLGWSRSGVVRVEAIQPPTNGSMLVVVDERGNALPHQLLSREWQPDGGGTAPGFDLYFEVLSIPPLGCNTYYLATKPIPTPNTITQTKRGGMGRDNDPITLESGMYEMYVEWDEKVSYYKLRRVTNKQSGRVYDVSASIMEYSSYLDGAYILSTMGEAVEVKVASNGSGYYWELDRGAVVQQLKQYLSNNITLIYRLYNSSLVATNGSSEFIGKFFEIFLSVALAEDKEMILRLDVTPSPSWGADTNGGSYYSDNGVELLPRGRNIIRFQDTELRNRIAGNYYPIQSTSLLRDTVGELLLLTRQSVGGSSQKNNSIEVLFHRRTIHDDGRGVGQPPNDTSRLNIPFRIILDDVDRAERDRVPQSLNFEYPLQVFYGDTKKLLRPIEDISDWTDDYYTSLSPLDADFPRNVHLLSFRPVKGADTPKGAGAGSAPFKCLMRLQNMYSIDTPYTPYNTSATIDLSKIFNPSRYSLQHLTQTSLSANAILDTSGNTNVTLMPIDMKSMVVDLSGSSGGDGEDRTVAIIVGSVVGGIVVGLVTIAVLFLAIKYRGRILSYLGIKSEYEIVDTAA